MFCSIVPGPLPDEWLGGAAAFKMLRAKLTWFFVRKGRKDAEELADETLFRATKNLAMGKEAPNLDAYCFGIARLLWLEMIRRIEPEPLDREPPSATTSDPSDAIYLEQLLSTLSADDRDVFVRYFLEDRAVLARELGISANALRLRVYYIRKRLRLS